MKFVQQGAEWIHLVDLDAAMGRKPNLDQLMRIVENVDVKIEVAGGIRSADIARTFIDKGASKVVLGTLAIKDHSFIDDVSTHIDSKQIAVAVDVKGEDVMIEGWTRQSGKRYPEVLKMLNKYSFCNIIVTNVEADGTLHGPQIELIEECVHLSEKPVYAAGGVKSLKDIRALNEVGVKGIIIGKSLYEGTLSLKEAIEEIKKIT